MGKPFIIAFFLILVYAGYCFGTIPKGELFEGDIRLVLLSALIHPLPVRVTETTTLTVGGALLIGIYFLLKSTGDTRNYMPGLEYGSSRIATPDEVNKKLKDKDEHNNKIISEKVRISMNTRKTGLNNNMMVIGGSGAGKSFYMVKPNGYNHATSIVATDPKGELLRDLGNYLEEQDYQIKVLNLIDMDASDGFNPFEYIRSDEDIEKLITNLMANTVPKDAQKGDPFWDDSVSMLFQSIMQFLWRECPRLGKRANFKEFLDLLNKAKINDDDKAKSELDILMEELPADHPARVTYLKVMSGAADTKRSILISAHSRLNRMQNPKVLRILDYDEIDIPSLGIGQFGNNERKVALFLVIPDNDKTYNFIVGLMYTLIFQQLYYLADHVYGGRLPVHVALWLDEFANVQMPDSFCEILSTMRSREISCNIIIQSQAQLKALFKDSHETILGNCDTLVYLGGNEVSSHKLVSEMMGKHTIDKKTSGETLGSHGSSSRNYDVLGRDWMDAAEVRKFDNTQCVIFIRGFDAVVDDKYHTPEKEEFKNASALGPYEHKKDRSAYQYGKLNLYLNNYKKKKGEGDISELYASIRSQIERYGFICSETEGLSEILEEKTVGDKSYLVLPMEAAMYSKGSAGMTYAPVFDPEEELIRSGPDVFHVYRIIGRWSKIDVDEVPAFFTDPKEQWKKEFNGYLVRSQNG